MSHFTLTYAVHHSRQIAAAWSVNCFANFPTVCLVSPGEQSTVQFKKYKFSGCKSKDCIRLRSLLGKSVYCVRELNFSDTKMCVAQLNAVSRNAQVTDNASSYWDCYSDGQIILVEFLSLKQFKWSIGKTTASGWQCIFKLSLSLESTNSLHRIVLYIQTSQPERKSLLQVFISISDVAIYFMTKQIRTCSFFAFTRFVCIFLSFRLPFHEAVEFCFTEILLNHELCRLCLIIPAARPLHSSTLRVNLAGLQTWMFFERNQKTRKKRDNYWGQSNDHEHSWQLSVNTSFWFDLSFQTCPCRWPYSLPRQHDDISFVFRDTFVNIMHFQQWLLRSAEFQLKISTLSLLLSLGPLSK